MVANLAMVADSDDLARSAGEKNACVLAGNCEKIINFACNKLTS